MKKRFIIVVNPAAGNCSLDQVEWVCGGLRAAGHDAEFRVSQFKGNCTELTRNAVNEGCDVVVAAGGDGTMNEIANALVDTDVPMAVFPRGSVNILAMEIGLKNSPQAILDYLLDGHPVPISLGCINDKHFLLMAGVGVDARAVAGVTEEIKEQHGKSAYVRKMLAEMRHPPGTRFEIRTPERTVEGSSIIVCNAKRYAGSFKMAPQADIRKPCLDVCVFESGRALAVLRYNLGLLFASHQWFPDVTAWETTEADIRCLNGTGTTEPVQVDGDTAGALPIHIETAPAALSLLVPCSD